MMAKFQFWTQMTARKGENFCIMSSSGLRVAYPSITEDECFAMMDAKVAELEKEGYTVTWQQEYAEPESAYGFMDVGGMTYDDVRYASRGE
jgi:hypothetical protein